MQIQQQTLGAVHQHDRGGQLREGDVYRAVIKEVRNGGEATIQVRGREIIASFEGGVPKGESATIEVVGREGDTVKVRAITSDEEKRQAVSGDKRQDISQTLRQLGVQKPSAETQQAAQMLMDKGVPLTKESVAVLQRFLAEGNMQERMQSIQAMANKGLEVTAPQLRSVHEALHGRQLNEVLDELASELDKNFKIEAKVSEVRGDRSGNVIEVEKVSRNTSSQRDGYVRDRVQVDMNKQVLQESVRSADSAIKEPAQLENRPVSEQIRMVQDQVRGEANIQRAAEQIRKQVVGHPQVSREFSQFLDRALAEATHLDKVGQERIREVISHLEKNASSEFERNIAKELRTLLQKEQSVSNTVVQAREILQQLTTENATKQHIEKAFSQAEQLEQVGKERMLQALAKVEQQMKQIESHFTTPQQAASQLANGQSLSEMIKQIQTQMQREANFDKAIQHLQPITGLTSLSEDLRSNLNQAIERAQERMGQGREIAARQQIMQSLEHLEQVTKATEQSTQPVETAGYERNEQFQTSVEMASKSIAVTTITEKLAQVTADFKSFQREITRTLDQVTRQIDLFRSQAQTQVKPLLETTIKKLDNAILRSEMMLLTDMKTEKSLMQASSQLAEAKKLLSKGKYQEANQIVKDVKQLVERLHFQPSETKVKHYVSINDRQLSEGRLPAQTYTQQYTETVSRSSQDGSPRAMFDMIRGLGLNRDSELAGQLASGRDGGQQEESQRNVKSALMQIIRSEEEGSRASQLASQALNNVTGQQLLSRSDQQGNLQSMFFNLPFLLQEKVENIQVFVNSRNEGQKVDWENCSLYFLLETPKMGEIGIMVKATERQLSITLKNDNEAFQLKMAPLVEKAIERLSDIGYSVNGIKFSKLHADAKANAPVETVPTQKPIFTKEGFDFSI
ncbi:DUF4175 domain-containing protein [bacterium LRH843]|nr:DUF4175 domain-containing protein [bacterium LRH843]